MPAVNFLTSANTPNHNDYIGTYDANTYPNPVVSAVYGSAVTTAALKYGNEKMTSLAAAPGINWSTIGTMYY